jgi:hypothetical protein
MAGPFYFAWVSPSETTFDAAVHNREDEDVFGFTVEHSEGDFAGLEIEIRNPRVGLLAPARKVHAFLSYDTGTEIKPLFRGRLVGIPDDINQEIVRLQFTARPDDYAAQKAALANTLRVLPYCDPVFISKDKWDDPDAVLEARSELWHIDRVTGELTTSDLLVGEDGNEDFFDSDVPYDSVSVHLNQTPLRTVTMDAEVGWSQRDSGTLPIYYNSSFTSFLADSVAEEWPKAGANLGGGWAVTLGYASSNIDNIPSDAFHTDINLPAPSDPIPEDQTVIEPPPPPPRNTVGRPIPGGWVFILIHQEIQGKSSATEASLRVREEGIIIPLVTVYGTLVVRYDADRNRKEHLRFTLQADTQPIITLPGEDEVLNLSISGNDVGKDVAGEFPIGSSRRRSYFPTARGLKSIEYLICLARAHLILRSRTVEVTFECSFERAIELSCRKNARVFDGRLPGGSALGKVIKYRFSADGDTGKLIGTGTIGCAIGFGGAVSVSSGSPTYVAVSYVETGYQFYEDQVEVLPAGDIGYTIPIDAPNDDGLVFPLTVVPFLAGPQFHLADLSAGAFEGTVDLSNPDGSHAAKTAIDTILKAKRCHLGFTIAPVNGQTFDNAYDITLTELVVPKMIDLEAAS